MPLRLPLPVLALVLALAMATAACGGGDEASGGITLENVRARTALASTGFGAVYLDIVNTGDTDDELVGASVPEEIAGVVEIHETVMVGDGDMSASASEMPGMQGMQMRQVDGVPVPAGETVTLEPGGLHVMLIELATDLEDGDSFEVDLEFAEAGTRTVTATVTTEP